MSGLTFAFICAIFVLGKVDDRAGFLAGEESPSTLYVVRRSVVRAVNGCQVY